MLFDEIEKAHPDVWNMLLQILEEGKLTDNVGRVVNFRNTIILMTTNVGSDIIKKQGTLGFAPANEEAAHEKMRERIMDEAKKTFRPEFLNRLDDVIVFRSFTKPDLITILSLEVEKVLARLRHKNLQLELDDKAKEFLVERGYDPQYGARPMRRAVERFLEDPLAEEILAGNCTRANRSLSLTDKERLVFNQMPPPPKALSQELTPRNRISLFANLGPPGSAFFVFVHGLRKSNKMESVRESSSCSVWIAARRIGKRRTCASGGWRK